MVSEQLLKTRLPKHIKYLLTVLLACFILYNASAQKSLQLKLYHNTDLFKVTHSTHLSSEETEATYTNFNRFSIAMTFSGKKNLRSEIELFIPDISRSVDNVGFPMHYYLKDRDKLKSTISTFSFRYELSKLFNPARNTYFSLGVGVNPYYAHIEYDPLPASTYYSARTDLFGIALNAVPRANIKISKRFWIDINIPFKLYDFRVSRDHVYNPQIPIRQQITKHDKNYFFEGSYTLRLGISYQLK